MLLYNELHFKGNGETLQHGLAKASPGELEKDASRQRDLTCAAGWLCWTTATVSQEERREKAKGTTEASGDFFQLHMLPVIKGLEREDAKFTLQTPLNTISQLHCLHPPFPQGRQLSSEKIHLYIFYTSSPPCPQDPHIHPSLEIKPLQT